MKDKNVILYAEDDSSVRSVNEMFLKNYFSGMIIETFEDGTSLEKRLNNGVAGVCMVITDNDMPGITGLEIIKKYAGKLDFPFILNSTSPDEVISEAVEVGAFYVPKPGCPELIEGVKKVFKKEGYSF